MAEKMTQESTCFPIMRTEFQIPAAILQNRDRHKFRRIAKALLPSSLAKMKAPGSERDLTLEEVAECWKEHQCPIMSSTFPHV